MCAREPVAGNNRFVGLAEETADFFPLSLFGQHWDWAACHLQAVGCLRRSLIFDLVLLCAAGEVLGESCGEI